MQVGEEEAKKKHDAWLTWQSAGGTCVRTSIPSNSRFCGQFLNFAKDSTVNAPICCEILCTVSSFVVLVQLNLDLHIAV